jgi:hypothetical protein
MIAQLHFLFYIHLFTFVPCQIGMNLGGLLELKVNNTTAFSGANRSLGCGSLEAPDALENIEIKIDDTVCVL